MKRNLVLLVFATRLVTAEFKGAEEAKAVFASEIQLLENLHNTTAQKGDLSVLMDSEAVRFIRAHHTELAQDITVFIDLAAKAHRELSVQKALYDFTHALHAFLYDPAVAQATSGKEIVTLESYQNMKVLERALRRSLHRYCKEASSKMPVLYSYLDAFYAYSDVLVEERFDKALSCLSWDEPLGNILQRVCDNDWEIAAFAGECEELLAATEFSLADMYVGHMVMILKAAEPFIHALLECFGSDFITNQIAALKVTDNGLDQKINAARLMGLLAHPRVQHLLFTGQKLVQVLPLMNTVFSRTEDEELGCDGDVDTIES